MGLRFHVEQLTDAFIAEATALFAAHHDEVGEEGFDLDLDWTTYRFLESQGQYVLLTVRDDGKLVGYNAFALHQHWHHKTVKQAVQDVLFLHPDHRRGLLGLRLVNFANDVLAERGVQLVTQHTTLKNDFSPVLERAGFEFREKVYERRLS